VLPREERLDLHRRAVRVVDRRVALRCPADHLALGEQRDRRLLRFVVMVRH
jgi:hypothetical protein